MKQTIKTDTAPSAIGPYSQAVIAKGGTIVFCSGRIPIDPKTREITGKSTSEQCCQVMDNIAALLKAAGSDIS